MALVQNCREVAVYFTDRGIEEPAERPGEDQVTPGWLAARLQAFAGLHPGLNAVVARADDGGRAVNRASPGFPGGR
jgi:hypothetical protein